MAASLAVTDPKNPYRPPEQPLGGSPSATPLEQGLAARRRQSFWLALGFPMGLAVLWFVESTFALNPNLAAARGRRIAVVVSLLLAAGPSVLSVVLGCAPIAFGDLRPLRWLIPLALGWLAFVSMCDWTTLFR